MDWNGADSEMPIAFTNYDLWFSSGSFGFNTFNSDIYGINSAGLANAWHLVTAVFNNGSVTGNQLWIDGAQQTLTQRFSPPVGRNVSTSAVIGGATAANSTGFRFSGGLDEVAFFNGTLTPAQIAAQYNARASGSYSATILAQNPVAYYRLGEAQPSVAVDSSGHGNDGTLVVSTSGTSGEIGVDLTSGAVTAVTVNSQGAGYTTAPQVFFSGGGGSGAAATATVVGGAITGITVTSGGLGYTSTPSITLVGGAAASATVTNGLVTGVTITSGGSGFSTGPAVTFSSAVVSALGNTTSGSNSITGIGSTSNIVSGTAVTGSGIPAGSVVTAITSANSITISNNTTATASGVSLLFTGTTAAGTATLSVTGVTITNGGTGYTTAPTVTFSAPPAGGTTATGTATVSSSGFVTGITITNPGSGYTSMPTVTFSASPSGTTATATAGGRVSGITITNGGSGYATAPGISFAGGASASASASVVVDNGSLGTAPYHSLNTDTSSLRVTGNGPFTGSGSAWPSTARTTTPSRPICKLPSAAPPPLRWRPGSMPTPPA